METNGTLWNTLETTCIVQVWARLTPTLTHVVTYELVTSGAEDDAMSFVHLFPVVCDVVCGVDQDVVHVDCQPIFA